MVSTKTTLINTHPTHAFWKIHVHVHVGYFSFWINWHSGYTLYRYKCTDAVNMYTDHFVLCSYMYMYVHVHCIRLSHMYMVIVCIILYRFKKYNNNIFIDCRIVPKRPTSFQFSDSDQSLLVADKSGEVTRYMYVMCICVCVCVFFFLSEITQSTSCF